MRRLRDLRFVRGDQVEVGELKLEGLRLRTDSDGRPLGSIAGAVIDTADRRVHSLVIDTWKGKRLVPFESAWIEPEEPSVRVLAAETDRWQRFDPASVGAYDDDAVMALLFPAA
jgi:sporulation protein YlmC with PRC-barrel domain